MVTGRELVDLPLNGRNFTQLGLLQTGVAPLTAGVATAGGSLRQGQAYAVNGMRPEQNAYLVDGGAEPNRMDGGYALQLPVDAIAEFRILTQSAPPEYGGTGGATTSVVTRSGGNRFTAASTSSSATTPSTPATSSRAEVEPLNQHQFGGTLGGPLSRDRAFFFGYYEGLPQQAGRDDDGDRADGGGAPGRFLGHGRAAASTSRPAACRFPATRFRRRRSTRCRATSLDLYPLGNVSPSIYRETLVGENELDQAGVRVDYHLVGPRPVVRPLLVLGRPQHQPDLGARHRRAGLSRRATTSARTRSSLSSTRIVTPTLTNTAARDRTSAIVPVRPAPGPQVAGGPRLRLRVVQ